MAEQANAAHATSPEQANAELYKAVICQHDVEVEKLLGSGARLTSDQVERVRSIISEKFASASAAMQGGDFHWGYGDKDKAESIQELLQKCLEAGNQVSTESTTGGST